MPGTLPNAWHKSNRILPVVPIRWVLIRDPAKQGKFKTRALAFGLTQPSS